MGKQTHSRQNKVNKHKFSYVVW